MTKVTVPLLILQGTVDLVTDPETAKELYQMASSTDKELKLYEGFWHALLADPEKEKVYDDMRQWLEKRL